ncbi:STAS domain-containing protein [Slackia piriformis]|jgi:anti-sigma B factor antagonist|nr:STAS domain-containing protein [Slackia piriformis]
MDITTSIDGTKATVHLTGSLNTGTAPDLEAALTPIFDQATELTFDFDGLEYVSSAGLRVLMVAYKQYGAITVEHACDEIREVFDITGFSDIIDVR